MCGISCHTRHTTWTWRAPATYRCTAAVYSSTSFNLENAVMFLNHWVFELLHTATTGEAEAAVANNPRKLNCCIIHQCTCCTQIILRTHRTSYTSTLLSAVCWYLYSSIASMYTELLLHDAPCAESAPLPFGCLPSLRLLGRKRRASRPRLALTCR